jgi:hypothetical protein
MARCIEDTTNKTTANSDKTTIFKYRTHRLAVARSRQFLKRDLVHPTIKIMLLHNRQLLHCSTQRATTAIQCQIWPSTLGPRRCCRNDKGPLFSVLLRDNTNAFGGDAVSRPADGSTVSAKASLGETASFNGSCPGSCRREAGEYDHGASRRLDHGDVDWGPWYRLSCCCRVAKWVGEGAGSYASCAYDCEYCVCVAPSGLGHAKVFPCCWEIWACKWRCAEAGSMFLHVRFAAVWLLDTTLFHRLGWLANGSLSACSNDPLCDGFSN